MCIGDRKDCLFTFAQLEVKQPTRCNFCHARLKVLIICFDSGSPLPHLTVSGLLLSFKKPAKQLKKSLSVTHGMYKI